MGYVYKDINVLSIVTFGSYVKRIYIGACGDGCCPNKQRQGREILFRKYLFLKIF